MIPEKTLKDAHFNSWYRLQKLLYVGNVPYINLSDKTVTIPNQLLPQESPSSKKIDFEIDSSYYYHTVSSEGILVVRPLYELRSGKLSFKRPKVEIRYYIPGTSVPTMAREIYDEKRLVGEIIKANIENSFREINPGFYCFFEHFRSSLFTESKRYRTGRILSEFFEPHLEGIPEQNVGKILVIYMRSLIDYFLSKVRPEPTIQKEKDVLMETLEKWEKERGLKTIMENPWEILRETMWTQNDDIAENVIFKKEILFDIFSENLKEVYKLEINGEWTKLK